MLYEVLHCYVLNAAHTWKVQSCCSVSHCIIVYIYLYIYIYTLVLKKQNNVSFISSLLFSQLLQLDSYKLAESLWRHETSSSNSRCFVSLIPEYNRSISIYWALFSEEVYYIFCVIYICIDFFFNVNLRKLMTDFHITSILYFE